MNTSAFVGSSCKTALEVAWQRYSANNPKSLVRHVQACNVLPGGNTRTSLFYFPFPLTMLRGEGSRLWDVDGHEYIDFLGDYTAGIFGHSHPIIRAALIEALDLGIDLGGHSSMEARLADLICGRFPSIDLVRFTNSGTEANLMAVSAACAITKRSEVLVFEGAYHGSLLSFPRGGNLVNAPFDFIIAPYNNLGRTIDLVRAHAKDLAAVMIEPMMGTGGCIPAEAPFLQALRETTLEHGIILIFDEVMTSRLSPGGLQQVYGILPDVTTLGKYIGGGVTFGAFGGRTEIMERFDPRRSTAFAHAGTFNNNVLTMMAGIAGMSLIYTPEVSEQHNRRGDLLRKRLNDLVNSERVSMQFTGMGSMLHVHMRREPIRNPDDAAFVDVALRDLFFFDLIGEGIWLSPRGMITLSLPVSDSECEHLVNAVGRFIAKRQSLLHSVS